MGYPFTAIEAKWQAYWQNHETFKADQPSDLPKYYVLDMFPYPSGAGLHVGHPLGYIATDIVARFKRHQGYNVLHPQGYDSFGLPAEQYAIQTGQHPAITTQENIDRYREQMDRMGFSFDWSREVRTSNADFYRWTQWIFLQLFDSYYCFDQQKALPIAELINIFERSGSAGLTNRLELEETPFTAEDWKSFSETQKEEVLQKFRLTFLAETEVNWCPELGTVLANDEIINGVSERGGYPVTKKKMKQWVMRISVYAERLLDGLEGIDWPEPLKEIQRNWIGKSTGATVFFSLKDHPDSIEVFTTRPDTLFGVTFMTLAPEHPLVEQITTPDQKEAVQQYQEKTAQRSERDRMADTKTISGVFTGAYALHPFTQEQIPIWIGDYVLSDYGTGAVMAVPCGDERDYNFAKYFNIPIANIFEGIDISEEAFTEKGDKIPLKDSDFLNGLTYQQAMPRVIEALEAKKMGRGTVNYRLRDAVFSRQRYWGEPIPIYFKNGVPKPIAAEHLPLELPEVDQYLPTADGAPPLGNAKVWAWDTQKNEVVSNTLIDQKTVFPLELNTMPGWAGSSWYFYRYMDATNSEEFVSAEAANYWKDVDLYLGGREHATGHLLYSRFWQKFLFDRAWLPVDEYAKKLVNQGMILGSTAFVHRLEGTQQYVSADHINGRKTTPIRVDVSLVNDQDEIKISDLQQWQPQFATATFEAENNTLKVSREVEKMSKSKYNVVNPDAICDRYGADTLRLYEMFLGPLEQAKPWNTAGISGVHNFLNKVYRLYVRDDKWLVNDDKADPKALKILHATIKKVQEDLEQLSFNTSVSAMMICVNELTALKCHQREILEPFAILISPFAPHLAEELWEKLGHTGGVSRVPFPEYNPSYLVESEKKYPVSFNGKVRFQLTLAADLDKQAIEEAVLADEQTLKYVDGKPIKKVIVVPGKIINIVV
ncbi:MAG: leucine--tRNA ligase [Flavobacteriaceae bacterium]